MQTPVRPTIAPEGGESVGAICTFGKTNERRCSGRKSSGYSPDQERRVSQREKQVSFGYATEGYRNMIRLVEHDPLMRNGGILPLPPPDVDKGSKRTWDILLRKWRRALHMFDSVFIEDKDEGLKTLDDVIEEQRLEWVSTIFAHEPKEKRVCLSAEKIREARSSPYVPTKIPVEDNLKIILRSKDCYEPVGNVVPPSASSLIKGTDISHFDAGIKIFVGPSSNNSQIVSTPSKSGAVSLGETPQHQIFNIPTPVQVARSASSVRTLPARYSGCQIGAGGNAQMWALPYDSTQGPTPDSPSVHIHQYHHVLPMSASKYPQPMSWRRDQLFAPPTYVPPSSHTSKYGAEKRGKCTPATAPRRVTFLQSKKKEENEETDEILQRRLFPNNINTPCNVDHKTNKNHFFASPREPLSNDAINIEVAKQPPIDYIAQRLFPEQ